MKFVFEKLLEKRDNVVCVDGLFDARLQISHWRENETPYDLKADTTTEMIFKLIESPAKEKHLKGIDIVSNNHFDADGLISAYVLVHPELALEYKESLINIARTGDFAEFTTEDALKANDVIESLMDVENGLAKGELKGKSYPVMMQLIYERGFSLLPELIDDIDKYEKYWGRDFDLFLSSESSFETQQSVFSNYSDCKLSVIESPFELHKISKFKHAEFDIVLSAVRTKDGNHYQLEYKPVTWFETLRRKSIVRKPFDKIMDKFKEIENSSDGEWKILGHDPEEEWDYRLIFADEKFKSQPSSLAVYELENILFELL